MTGRYLIPAYDRAFPAVGIATSWAQTKVCARESERLGIVDEASGNVIVSVRREGNAVYTLYDAAAAGALVVVAPAAGAPDEPATLKGGNTMPAATKPKAKPDPKVKTPSQQMKVGKPKAAKTTPKAQHEGVLEVVQPEPTPEVQAEVEPTPEPSSSAKRGKVSAMDAVVKVLEAASEPMHTKAIAEAVLAMPGVKMGGKTPEATIAAKLAVENKKGDGLFVRTSPGHYTMRKVD